MQMILQLTLHIVIYQIKNAALDLKFSIQYLHLFLLNIIEKMLWGHHVRNTATDVLIMIQKRAFLV